MLIVAPPRRALTHPDLAWYAADGARGLWRSCDAFVKLSWPARIARISIIQGEVPARDIGRRGAGGAKRDNRLASLGRNCGARRSLFVHFQKF